MFLFCVEMSNIKPMESSKFSALISFVNEAKLPPMHGISGEPRQKKQEEGSDMSVNGLKCAPNAHPERTMTK